MCLSREFHSNQLILARTNMYNESSEQQNKLHNVDPRHSRPNKCRKKRQTNKNQWILLTSAAKLALDNVTHFVCLLIQRTNEPIVKFFVVAIIPASFSRAACEWEWGGQPTNDMALQAHQSKCCSRRELSPNASAIR